MPSMTLMCIQERLTFSDALHDIDMYPGKTDL